MLAGFRQRRAPHRFSALQRAEIAEMLSAGGECQRVARGFSALQRAEIAEICRGEGGRRAARRVSVLFNEPKLLKSGLSFMFFPTSKVSVLFNEPKLLKS